MSSACKARWVGGGSGMSARKRENNVVAITAPEEDRSGRFWGGGRVIQVDRKGTTFQVGL